mmetsp:Transcript_59721/g.118647  ORF Transcript_59721/g.118647 Transcript_59721/m.118647 type:complete len:96 (-) Transcript_59721:1220-1507(-)
MTPGIHTRIRIGHDRQVRDAAGSLSYKEAWVSRVSGSCVSPDCLFLPPRERVRGVHERRAAPNTLIPWRHFFGFFGFFFSDGAPSATGSTPAGRA